MPHCILEYTNNIDNFPELSHLFDMMHKTLVRTREFREQDIKSRAIPLNTYFMGDGNMVNAFITLTVSILSGRNTEFRKKLSEDLLSLMKSYFDSVNVKGNLSLSVKIDEIDRDSYSKTFL